MSIFAPWRNPSIVEYKSTKVYIFEKPSILFITYIYSQLNYQPRTTCMPCSKPIRRKYSKNEVILPSDQRGSMAYHAVPRVMMYQGDARVPLEAEAILCGLRWWRTEVWNNGCFVRLGRCGIVIWRLIAHYYYWAGMSGVRPPCCSALLFGAWHVDPVAIYPTCRRQEVQNSWKGASTEEYTT